MAVEGGLVGRRGSMGLEGEWKRVMGFKNDPKTFYMYIKL